MKARPILFSTEMVQAILAGRKTQTRRVIQPQPPVPECSYTQLLNKCRYGQRRDMLWVRETWQSTYDETTKYWSFIFKADGKLWYDDDGLVRWKPGIYMPKAAARIWLQVTDIRVERVQDINKDDVISEGFSCLSKDHSFCLKHAMAPTWKYGLSESDGLPGAEGWKWRDWEINPVEAYRKLWSAINGTGSWAANPWVWVVSFRVLSTTGRPANLDELCAAS